jgi:ubiquitin carboxyl-terminal hydrolase L5
MSARGDVGDGSWCTIESDPGVFTELLVTVGVQGVMVDELWELEKEQLQRTSPVYGLIFLFKWRKERDSREVATDYGDLFFANQVINNACATQAILSVVLNGPESLHIGPELEQFKEFVKDFPPDSKGLAISNSDMIRVAHNSFAPAEPFVSDAKTEVAEDDDVFHFISYVPFRGHVYELDGLKAGPILLGTYDEGSPDSWFDTVIPQIKERIARYSQEEIHFNLLSVVKDPTSSLGERIAEINAALEGADTEQTQLLIQEREQCQHQLQDLEERARNRKLENARRRHNYMPLLSNILRLFQEKQMLHPFVENARQVGDSG